MGGSVKKIIKPVISAFNMFSGGFNPFVALGVMAIGWLFMRSMKPDVPDFGTNDFEETERGILVNKQSNNACVPQSLVENVQLYDKLLLSTKTL